MYTTSCLAEKDAPGGQKWQEATLDDPKTCTVCGKQEGSPLVLADILPQGKSRHNGSTFLMNEEEYIALLNELFSSESSMNSIKFS